jgi:ribosome-associated heat shock protein Hsp15
MDGLRIDKFLWHARFCKSRSLAQSWVDAGEVLLNGRMVEKSSSLVKIADELEIPAGRLRRRLRILGLSDRRGPAAEARILYEELALFPPPDPI